MFRFVRAVFLFSLLSASTALAIDFGPPLQNLKTFTGRAELRTEGHKVTIRLLDDEGVVLQRFKVETSVPSETPDLLEIDAVQVMLWEGNLVVIVPQEGQAFHFAIPAINRQTRQRGAARRLPLTVNPEALDADLAQRYALIRIEEATSIVFVGGPAARLPESDDSLERETLRSGIGISNDTPPPPMGEGGISTCGQSCSIDCGANNSCSASCNGLNQCASCACPALCKCN